MKTKIIEVNERFNFEKDTHGWMLHDWKMGQDKAGNPKRHKRTTYHANLKQICKTIIDRSCGECLSMKEIAGLLANAETILTRRVEELQRGEKDDNQNR
jgi:hypothetical protein